MPIVKDDNQLPQALSGSAAHPHTTTLDDMPHNSVLLDILLRAGVWQPGAATEGVQRSNSRSFFTVDGKELYNAVPSTSSSTSSICAWNVCRLFRQVLQQSPEAVAQLLSEHHGGPCSALVHAAAAGMSHVLACLIHQVLGLRAASTSLPGDSCIIHGSGGGRSLYAPSWVGCANQKEIPGRQQGRGKVQGGCCAHHPSTPSTYAPCQRNCDPGGLLNLLAAQLPQQQQQQQPQPCQCYHCQNQQHHGYGPVPFSPPSSDPSQPLDPRISSDLATQPELENSAHATQGTAHDLFKLRRQALIQSPLVLHSRPTLDAPLHPVLHAPLCAASAAGHMPVVHLLLGFSSQPQAPESRLSHSCQTHGTPPCGRAACQQAGSDAGGEQPLNTGPHAQSPVPSRCHGCQCCLRKGHAISQNRPTATGFTESRSSAGMGNSSSFATEPRRWHSPYDVCVMSSTHRACTQALEGAASGGHVDICELLLGRGVRASKAALESAAGRGHEDLCRLLITHGVCVSNAAMESAARCGREGVCRLLLAHGARVTGEAVAGAVEAAGEWMVEARNLGERWPEGNKLLMSTAGDPSSSMSPSSASAAVPAPAFTAAAAAAAVVKPRGGDAALDCSSPTGQMTTERSPPRSDSKYPELDCAAGRVCCLLLSAAARAAAESRGTDSFMLRFDTAPSLQRLGSVQGTRLFPHGCMPVALPATSMLPPPGACVTGAASSHPAAAPADSAAAPQGICSAAATSMPSPPGTCVTDAGTRAALSATSMLSPPAGTCVTGAGARSASALPAALPGGGMVASQGTTSMPSPPGACVTGAASSHPAAAPADSKAAPQGTHSAAAGAQGSPHAEAQLTDSAPPIQGLCSTIELCSSASRPPTSLTQSNLALDSSLATTQLRSATELTPFLPACSLGIDLSKALGTAAKHGLLGLSELLLACCPRGPARVDLDSALSFAAQEGHSAVCELLLRAGAATQVSEGAMQPDPLILAACHGHKEVVALLLAYGAAPDAGDNVALTLAASSGHEEVCALLLEYGARADSDRVCIALIEAAKNGHAPVCVLLLAHGARADAGDSWPLRAAAKGGHAEVCALLLAHGADAHARNDQAMQAAQARGHDNVCRLLKGNNNAGASSPLCRSES